MGNEPFIKATLVVILGGLGSLRGSFVAAFIVGLIESFTTAILGVFWAPTVLFVLIVTMIIIRPTGLFGGNKR
jgi:branched-chain amino acid transport system permease protein